MPRYVVERGFDGGLHIPIGKESQEMFAKIRERNAEQGVTWVHSYVTDDKSKTFCVYDAPNAEAIRKVAAANGLPVGQITMVTVLDPYFYA